jgi:hypothetical protein
METGEQTGAGSPTEWSERAVGLSTRSVEWLGRGPNRARAGQSFDPIMRQLRRNTRLATRLRAAAANPPSIAVYGASQAGKSYLIAHLAASPTVDAASGRPQQSALVLPHCNGGAIPFLEFNPGGGGESTGLVTRFTKRQILADANFPVLIKLLTVLDLVKILTGCFAVDLNQVDEKQPDAEKLKQVLDDVQRLPRSGRTAFNADDIFEIKEVCRSRYENLSNFKALLDFGYFDTAASLLEGLDIDGLTRLLEPLWNSVPRFSKLFALLVRGLSTIDFATTVNCQMDALLPRTNDKGVALTVLDVATLKRLFSGGSEPVTLRHSGGTAQLDRPIVAALAAELVLNLAGETRPFLESVDLLDFPGARSRGDITRGKLEEPAGTEDVFLRGKVAHLFDRYREEYDLTSMILCVGPSVQEVVPLRTLVAQWIDETHGRTPEARARATTALFLVLTKFDMQFERKAGEDTTSGDRWKKRLDAAITEFLGKSGTWTTTWAKAGNTTTAFNNVFWYRNPFVEQPNIFEYQTTSTGMRELGVLPRLTEEVAAMRESYLATDLVRQHIAKPADAWNAVMTLNDGGITYLADHLTKLGRSQVKRQQIFREVERIAGEIDRNLRPLYFHAEPAAQRAARRRDAETVARQLAVAGERKLFGRIIARLMVTRGEMERVYRAARLREVTGDGPAAPLPPVPSVPPVGGNIWDRIQLKKDGAGATATAAPPPAPSAVLVDDLAGRFSSAAVSYWTDKVMSACRNEELLRAFGLTPDGAQILGTELIAGARRIGIAAAFADASRRANYANATGGDLDGSTPALMAAGYINDYVSFLGRRGATGDPLVADNPPDPRFVRPPQRDEPALAEHPRDTAADFCVEWIRSFLDLVDFNATSMAGTNFDVAQNDALGAILADIESFDVRQGPLNEPL